MTNTEYLRSNIREHAEDLLRAKGDAKSTSIPMGDKLILIGPPSELARMLGYGTEAAHISAMTGAARLWLGVSAEGKLAQYFTEQPEASDYPALTITEYVCVPAAAASAGVAGTIDTPPSLPIKELLAIYDEQDGDWCKIAREVESRYLTALAAARASVESFQQGACKLAAELAKLRAATAPVSAVPTDSELEFNATRLRNVAKLVGLGSAIPADDAELDGARGSVLGMIAGKLRAGAPVSAAEQGDPIGELQAEARHRKLEDFIAAARPAGGQELPALGWQPLAKAGQIQKGDKLRFICGDKAFEETARLILEPGTDKEEVVYNIRQNFYFITSMAIKGTSSHKCVEFLAAKQAGKEPS
jgi:hypothetical protein